MAYYSTMTATQQQKLDSFIEQSLPAQIAALQALLRIPSEKAAPVETPGGMLPFGVPMQQALDCALAHARALGFSVRDLDGYVGVAEYGQGEETLGILAHLDVVPAGEGWSVPPFSGTEKDGRIYGRGASDDKGPALCAIYALAAVVAAGIPLKRKVQIILGCDEESGWDCITHFKKVERLPDMAFTPDAEYPLIYSEKHIYQGTFRLDSPGKGLCMQAGERANVVPGTASATLAGTHVRVPAVEGFQIALQPSASETTLRVDGLGAHASMPELGRNALLALLQALCQMELPPESAQQVRALADALRMDLHGETMGLDASDESGRLTLNPGVLRWDESGAEITFDSRVPHSLSEADINAAIGKALAPAGFKLKSSAFKNGHRVPLDSELVQRLIGVYQAQTGDTKSRPLAIGGGTYARALPNAVAFGCEFPGQPLVAHMADEFISIEDIVKNTRIMADAIIALTGA